MRDAYRAGDTWQPNVASREFLQNRVMDGFIFLFLTVVVLLLYMEEKEKGYATLTVTTRGGRQYFYCKKTGTLFLFTLFTVSVYEGMLLAYYVWRLGAIIWEAPIQSIAVFEMCCYSYNVRTVIILTILLKVLFFYILALTLSGFACRMSKMLSFLGMVAIIVLLSVVWEQSVDINGSAGWLTCIIPAGLPDTAGLIIQYRQFPVLGKPVSGVCLTGIFMGLLMLVSVVAGFLFCAGNRKCGKTFLSAKAGYVYGLIRRFRHNRMKKQLERHTERVQAGRRGVFSNGLFFLELRKSMISYRMLLPVLFVTFVCVVAYFVLDEKPMTQQENFYREYMMVLNGPLTPEKEQFILEERERFHNLEAFRNELLAQGGDQGLLLGYIENEMVKKSAFDLVEMQYACIQEDGGVFLYETGYLYLLGIEENESGHVGVFLGILILTLLLPALLWIEINSGADGLVRTTACGRSRLLRIQYAVCLLTAVLLFGSICAEDAAKIFRQFGNYGMTQSMGNIRQLDGFLSGCSVGAYLIIVYILRLLGVALAALFAMACMYRCRDYLSTALMCGMFLVIPDLLFMNGFSFMRGYFMNVLLQGEECLMLIRQGQIGTILLVLLQMGLCIGWSFGILKKEVKRR